MEKSPEVHFGAKYNINNNFLQAATWYFPAWSHSSARGSSACRPALHRCSTGLPQRRADGGDGAELLKTYSFSLLALLLDGLWAAHGSTWIFTKLHEQIRWKNKGDILLFFFFFNNCQKDPPKMPPNPAFCWKASLSILFWSILFPLQFVTFCWKLWWRTYVCGKLHPWEILELLHSVLLPKALR